MAPVTLVLCVAGFVALLVAWLAGGAAVDVAWAPALDLRLHARVDGLGALYGLLATGIGAVVAAYAIAYLPRHLAHQDRPARDGDHVVLDVKFTAALANTPLAWA